MYIFIYFASYSQKLREKVGAYTLILFRIVTYLFSPCVYIYMYVKYHLFRSNNMTIIRQENDIDFYIILALFRRNI